MTCFDDLPDAILQECFARLPRRYMARAKAVCKRWKLSLSDAALIYDLRRRKGLTEEWEYAVSSKFERSGGGGYEGGIEVRGGEAKPDSGGGRRSTPASILKGGAPRLLFAATAGGDGRRIYVLGGRTPLASGNHYRWIVFRDVHFYDPVVDRWAAAAPMMAERYAFAAAAPLAGETLAVAGGYDGLGRPLQSAEIYDVRADIWSPIPPMRRLSGACRGRFLNGKFYVLMANHNHNRNQHHAVEAYDPSVNAWTSVSMGSTSTTDGDDAILRSLLHPSSSSSSCSSTTTTASFTHLGPIILNL